MARLSYRKQRNRYAGNFAELLFNEGDCARLVKASVFLLLLLDPPRHLLLPLVSYADFLFHTVFPYRIKEMKIELELDIAWEKIKDPDLAARGTKALRGLFYLIMKEGRHSDPHLIKLKRKIQVFYLAFCSLGDEKSS